MSLRIVTVYEVRVNCNEGGGTPDLSDRNDPPSVSLTVTLALSIG